MKRFIPLVLSGLLLGYANNPSLAKEIDRDAISTLENPPNELKLNSTGFKTPKNLTHHFQSKNEAVKNEYNDSIFKIMSMFYNFNNPEPVNGCGISIPNSFEPNVAFGDILNIESSGISKLDLKIFNQWGLKVLESKFVNQSSLFDIGNPFSKKIRLLSTGNDDVSSNNQLAEGNYYYVLEVCCQSGDKITKEGEIKLLRTQRK
jgi:hypothetical protein